MEMWCELSSAQRVLLGRGRRWRCGVNCRVRGGCCLYGVVNGDVVRTRGRAASAACTGSSMEMWWELSRARRVLLVRGRRGRSGVYWRARDGSCLFVVGIVDVES